MWIRSSKAFNKHWKNYESRNLALKEKQYLGADHKARGLWERDCDSLCWPKGTRPLGSRMIFFVQILPVTYPPRSMWHIGPHFCTNDKEKIDFERIFVIEYFIFKLVCSNCEKSVNFELRRKQHVYTRVVKSR